MRGLYSITLLGLVLAFLYSPLGGWLAVGIVEKANYRHGSTYRPLARWGMS